MMPSLEKVDEKQAATLLEPLLPGTDLRSKILYDTDDNDTINVQWSD